jgi:secreted trypsin-like serine protease
MLRLITTRTPRRLLIGAVLVLAVLPASASARGPLAQSSIVNGRAADVSSYPWLGSILNDGNSKLGAAGPEIQRHSCAGSLVAATVLLTAAHCVTDGAGEQISPALLHVVFGKSRLGTPGGETVDVTAIHRDPAYDPGTYSNDAALLVLSGPVAIAPVRLAPLAMQLREGTRATIVGWGRTGEQEGLSPQLRSARVPLWSNARCYAAYARWVAPHEPSLQLCAAKRRGGVDTCDGDSGGPLLLRRAGATVQIGIVSFGNGCARRGWPGIYAWTASPFLQPWIARNVAALATGNTDHAAPAITGFAISGSRVGYQVSEVSEVVVAVQRRIAGTTLTLSTALIQNAAAGQNVFDVPRRLRGRPLPRGRYILRATALDAAGNRSAAATATFRVD